jgi:carbamoyltransferase
VLNTSFNLHGLPIVRTAADALDVFRRSGLENMQLASFMVSKTPLPATAPPTI